jgi:hypothetical protein
MPGELSHIIAQATRLNDLLGTSPYECPPTAVAGCAAKAPVEPMKAHRPATCRCRVAVDNAVGGARIAASGFESNGSCVQCLVERHCPARLACPAEPKFKDQKATRKAPREHQNT